jgi:hypothetical protein
LKVFHRTPTYLLLTRWIESAQRQGKADAKGTPPAKALKSRIIRMRPVSLRDNAVAQQKSDRWNKGPGVRQSRIATMRIENENCKLTRARHCARSVHLSNLQFSILISQFWFIVRQEPTLQSIWRLIVSRSPFLFSRV